MSDTAVWIGFVGHCDQGNDAVVDEFEDAVLALLPRHGGRVVGRGHRAVGQSDTLPAEVQILYFPSRRSYQEFLDDPARHDLLARFGDVFTSRVVVELRPPADTAASIGTPAPR